MRLASRFFFFFANFFMHNPKRYLNEHIELLSVPNNRSETKICKRRALMYGSPPGEADHHLLHMIFRKVNDYHLLRVLALLHLVRWMTGFMVRSNSPFTVQCYRPMLANTRHSRILDPIPCILDSGCWILVFSSGTWILDLIALVGFLSSILDSKARDSEFHIRIFPDSGSYKEKFSRFRNPDTLTWGEVQVKHFLTCSRIFN